MGSQCSVLVFHSTGFWTYAEFGPVVGEDVWSCERIHPDPQQE